MPENETAAIRFTPAQSDAIHARGGSLLVSAAAGSGKTRVLVERVAGMITDPNNGIDADSLLVVTFTTAAAAKLRADITERLAAEIRSRPGDTRLRRQQMRLQRASIGTVDAFCLHFIQQNFSALDVPPDVEIADDASLFRLRQETLAAVLEQAYADADFRAFADLYGRGRSDEAAGNAVLELYDFTQSLPAPEKALQYFADMWCGGEPLPATMWGRALLGAACDRVKGIAALLDAAMQAAARDSVVDAAYTAVLDDDATKMKHLLGVLQAGDWDKAIAALEEDCTWRALGRIKGGKGGNPASATASALHDRAKELAKSLQGDFLLCTADEFAQDRRRAAPLVAALVRTVLLFAQALYKAKLAEKILDYSDYEHLTLSLLTDADGSPSRLCATVRSRYSAVLVDEYQDTNALQDAIYRLLANPDGTNLFCVGDIKQSIYRFRQADPSVFIEKQTGWQPYPQGQQPPLQRPATIALDRNFRSAPNVIGGINYLFETIFSEQLGGIAYGEGQRLVVGNADGDYPGLCKALVMPEADAESEARTIAAHIAEMKHSGFAVRAKQGTRPCDYGDFCILLRGRANFGVYEQALQAAGIPVYADTASDLLDAPHIRPFAALLNIIDNPAQDVDLAAVLLSPMFPYKPDDLVLLRTAAGKASLYSALLHYDNAADDRFVPFMNKLAEFRRLARTLPVDTLIEELFARTGYLAAAGAMPDGARCRDDLHAFAAWAAGAGRSGLAGVIRAMNAVRQKGGLTQSGGGQARPGCVSIMTVHRSKGLEFPIVFVADTGHHFNTADLLRPVLCHRHLGVGLMLRDGDTASRYKTLPYAALGQTIKAETYSEEMRILYVALTRAQDALFVMLPLKKGSRDNFIKSASLCAYAGTVSAETLQRMSSWAGWLLTAVMLHPDSDEVWKYCDFLPRHTMEITAPLSVRIVTPPEQTEKAEATAPAAPDMALCKQLLQSFAWRNPEDELRSIPAKVSVSALTHAARQISLERPAFMQKNGMTGAERGTAIHAFMQSVPLDGAAIDLAAEVERQKQQRLLDAALAEKLDLGVVKAFFAGAVWRRIRLAKQVLREEPFITALPACEAIKGVRGTEKILVQGIADMVLVFDDHAEILDYKTDRSTDPDFYIKEYAGQLRLYRRAFAARLRVPVTKLTIYSFTLAAELDVPLH